jgi:preprotein translocase subunit SecD
MTGNRRLVVPLLVVFAMIIGIWGLIFVQHIKPRLGLDLTGGTSVIYEPHSPDGKNPTDDQLNTTIDIIRNRVNSKGVAESEVNLEGGNIVVSIPSVKNPDEVLKAVGTTAQLRFRPVLQEATSNAPEYKKAPFAAVDCGKPNTWKDPIEKETVLCAREPGQDQPDPTAPKLLMGKLALGGTDISKAEAQLATSGQNGITTGQWETALTLSGKGAKKFATITGDLACNPSGDPKRRLGITLDSVVINSPPMADDVQCHQGIAGGSAVITGQTEAEAKALAPLISTGALPLTLTAQTRSTVSATLGADSLHSGLVAGALGLAAVFLYVLLFYRGLGLVAWIGLAIAAAFNFGIVILMGKLIGFTLTLAGIAGLIVAVGISADSYVVFFERLKDEVRDGKTLRASVDRGWARSFHTLVSANTVSFAAALVLYLLAVGPVRGFAFTLGLATAVDFFTAWMFGRPAVSLFARTRLLREGRLAGIRAAI